MTLRICYGIHGFGRGHATRAKAVLPTLGKRHELFLLAGGEAFDALISDYPVIRIPTIRYIYNTHRKISVSLTVRYNLPALLDLWLTGPMVRMVAEHIQSFRPDVVVTDSEAYSHQAAQHLGTPRISFDHFGLLVHCRPEMSRLDRVKCRGQSMVYRLLFGRPNRSIVSSFFPAPAIRKGVCVVGPTLRQEARQAEPTRGDHLLVYVSQPNEFTPMLASTLRQLNIPVRVYGAPQNSGSERQVEYKAISNLPFLEDLASCRAICATTGNQLMGEVIHFGKPILGFPVDCLEQRLNARQIEKLGIGMKVSRANINLDVLQRFLANEETFLRNARALKSHDGEREAVEAIERYATELIDAPPIDHTSAESPNYGQLENQVPSVPTPHIKNMKETLTGDAR